MVMFVGLSSCSGDDSKDYKDYGNLEVIVNGIFFKYNDILGVQTDTSSGGGLILKVNCNLIF